jgi:ubiquinone/menaquinone biosynthesis C-methylase UbiE
MTSYPFADRTAEFERLIAQGSIFDPLTRLLLREAGLGPGMRVLDIGSGAGNVARLAADIVGPGGTVVGVDAPPAAVELASQHNSAPNIEFRAADAHTLDGIEDGF